MNRRYFIFGAVAIVPGSAFAAAKKKAIAYRGPKWSSLQPRKSAAR